MSRWPVDGAGGGRSLSSKTNKKAYNDTLWRKYIYRKWNGKCVRCGTASGLQAAHIFRRGLLSTRWDPENGLLLCTGPGTKNCHYWFDNIATPAERRAFTVLKIGEESVSRLEAVASVMWDKDFERPRQALKQGK